MGTMSMDGKILKDALEEVILKLIKEKGNDYAKLVTMVGLGGECGAMALSNGYSPETVNKIVGTCSRMLALLCDVMKVDIKDVIADFDKLNKQLNAIHEKKGEGK